MIGITMPKRVTLLSRTALGLALTLGVAAGGLVPQPVLAAKPAAGPKIEFSPGFSKAAAALDKTLTDAAKNPTVQAAQQQVQAAGSNAQAKAAAVAQVDAALGGNVKAQLDAAVAAATTPGDKFKAGDLTRTYGTFIDDAAMQHRGFVMMLDSGVTPPAVMGQVEFLAGYSAYRMGDYAGAARYVQQAKDAGFQQPQLDALLSDSYKRSNNPQAALQNAQHDIAAAQAAGTKPSEASIRTALQAAYDAKQTGPSIDLAVLLVQDYPSPQSWNSAITVARALARLPDEENLDLMRLMARTGAMKNKEDYLEYMQNAAGNTGVLYPGEVVSIAQQGVSAGILQKTDNANILTAAQGMIAQDRASLPSQESDARKPTANGKRVLGAADALLSYNQPAKAEELYKLALTKPDADKDRALTRLGIAQVDQGKFAEAKASFDQVNGTRKPIARLWSVYAAQKAGGGAAPAAN